MGQQTAMVATSGFSTGLFLDVIGILIGVYAVVRIVSTLSKVGGQVGSAFTLTLVGMLFQMIALGYDLLVEEFRVFPDFKMQTPIGVLMSHNLHEALMILGIIFFVLASLQFGKLSK